MMMVEYILSFSLNVIDVSFAVQEIMLNQVEAEPLLISGWSRKETSSPIFTVSPDYSLYADIKLMNGEDLFGETAEFIEGPYVSGWQYASHMIQ